MKIEKILGIIFILGFIIKVSNIHFGSLLTIISLGVLSLLYFPFGYFLFKKEKIASRKNLQVILIGWTLFMAVCGTLFKLQSWTGWQMMLPIALICNTVLIIYLSTIDKSENSTGNVSKSMIIRTSIILAIAVTVYLIPNHILFSK